MIANSNLLELLKHSFQPAYVFNIGINANQSVTSGIVTAYKQFVRAQK